MDPRPCSMGVSVNEKEASMGAGDRSTTSCLSGPMSSPCDVTRSLVMWTRSSHRQGRRVIIFPPAVLGKSR